MKRFLAVLLCLLALTLSAAAQAKKSPMKKSPTGPVPDKAYLQKIWDGWSTLNPARCDRGSPQAYAATPLRTGF